MSKQFPFFAMGSGLYALFYTFCMYRNSAGITFPFFVAGSIFFFCLCLKKLEIAVKKDSWWYSMAMLLLGISSVLTADGRIIFFNQAGVLLLMISFLLHQFYRDENWSFGGYTKAILAAFFGAIGRIGKPFADLGAYRSGKEKKSGNLLYVGIGLCVSVPLLLVVWFLLMSADRMFMNLTEEFFDAIDLPNIIGIVCSAAVMFLLSYGVLAYLGERRLKDEAAEHKRAESALAVTIMLPLTVLYVVFSGVQIFCLFLGNVDLEYMTYAEYARQGFFQLLFVSGLNLILVLVGSYYFKESNLLKIIMTIVSLCTYIMIFSSGYRMILYIKHYYLTFLRILVLWALVVLFVLLTGVLISIFRRSFPLFRFGILVVSVCYIVLAFSRPDHLIASCNLANAGEGQVHSFFDADAYHDYRYLSELGPDAATVILPYLEEQGYDLTMKDPGKYYNRYQEDGWGYFYLEELRSKIDKMGVRSFNISKYRAGRLLD